MQRLSGELRNSLDTCLNPLDQLGQDRPSVREACAPLISPTPTPTPARARRTEEVSVFSLTRRTRNAHALANTTPSSPPFRAAQTSAWTPPSPSTPPSKSAKTLTLKTASVRGLGRGLARERAYQRAQTISNFSVRGCRHSHLTRTRIALRLLLSL